MQTKNIDILRTGDLVRVGDCDFFVVLPCDQGDSLVVLPCDQGDSLKLKFANDNWAARLIDKVGLTIVAPAPRTAQDVLVDAFVGSQWQCADGIRWRVVKDSDGDVYFLDQATDKAAVMSARGLTDVLTFVVG